MNKSIREIKKEARTRVNNDFGDAFIIVFVPFFIMNAVIIFLSQITMFLPDILEFYIEFALNVFLNILAVYLAFKLLIQHVRSKNELTFNNFFALDSSFLNFIILRLLLAIVFILIHVPSIPVLLELVQKVSIMVDPNAIEGYLLYSDIVPRLIGSLQISSILLILFWLSTIRFQMIPFILIDKKVGLIEAFRISYQITKGSYFKILIFPFTYILWSILLITFIGAFYVIPLVFMGYGYLYLSMCDNTHQE